MIQKHTTNQSFINMWRYLQDMGVENSTFILELHDESLKDFKLTDLETDDKKKRAELVRKVHEECERNIWFFFREIIRIPNPIACQSNQGCVGETHYILNPTELNMIYAYQHGINLISKLYTVSKGIRTTISLLEMYSQLFRGKDNRCIVTYDESVDDNLRMARLRNHNYTSFPLACFDDIVRFHSIQEESELKVTVPEVYCNDVFLHVNNASFSKENFYENLYELNSREPVHIYGYMVDKNEPLTNYEKMIEKMMFSKLPVGLELYDKPDMVISKDKIYFQ